MEALFPIPRTRTMQEKLVKDRDAWFPSCIIILCVSY
jgi:hypothetical protein